MAPWLIDWSLDNRSAMVRVPPERVRCLADPKTSTLADPSLRRQLTFVP